MSDCPKDYGQRHARECVNGPVTEHIIEGAWGDGYVAASKDLAALQAANARLKEALKKKAERNDELQAENASLRAECIRLTPFVAIADPIKASRCEEAWQAWLSGKEKDAVQTTRVPAYLFMSGWAIGNLCSALRDGGGAP